jgi:hypothetical protein
MSMKQAFVLVKTGFWPKSRFSKSGEKEKKLLIIPKR